MSPDNISLLRQSSLKLVRQASNRILFGQTARHQGGVVMVERKDPSLPTAYKGRLLSTSLKCIHSDILGYNDMKFI